MYWYNNSLKAGFKPIVQPIDVGKLYIYGPEPEVIPNGGLVTPKNLLHMVVF